MDAQMVTEDWPHADLEYLGQCPICGSSQRTVMFDDLADWSFRVAPGQWTMWNCSTCSSAYLDPRPTEASIGRAYNRYYTHESADPKKIALPSNSIRRLKELAQSRLGAAYYRLTVGHNVTTLDFIGGLLFQCFPEKVLEANIMIRHLSRPEGTGERLLDIGCGSGHFLHTAAKLGYEPFGIDPDSKAIGAAYQAGFNVQQGSLPETGFPDEHFAHVTLSHVFEHLHDPRESMLEVLRVLKPGGRLWMALPNRDALGLELFGKYWRGLEVPRHLVLPIPATLKDKLLYFGFSDVQFLEHPRCGGFIAEASTAMRAGLDPSNPSDLQSVWQHPETASLARTLDRNAHANPKRAEIMIVIARKQKSP